MRSKITRWERFGGFSGRIRGADTVRNGNERVAVGRVVS
jgi:hypothetical protein